MRNPETLPRVSIVLPSFNQCEYLDDALRSIKHQNYPNLELIVVDGGSRDSTRAVVESYGNLVTHFISEPDEGQSDALNKGFRIATGEWFGWMNADDRYCPNALNILTAAATSSPDTYVVYGDVHILNEHGRVTSTSYASDFSMRKLIYYGFHFWTQGMLWRASLHRKYGEIPIHLHRAMDYDLFIGLATHTPPAAFKRIAAPVGEWRRHADQKTRTYPGRKRHGQDDQSYSEHLDINSRYKLRWRFTLAGRAVGTGYRLLSLLAKLKRSCDSLADNPRWPLPRSG